MALEFTHCFLFRPPQGIGLSLVLKMGYFLSLWEVYIQNLGVLFSLESSKKFVVLVKSDFSDNFSLGQAEQ